MKNTLLLLLTLSICTVAFGQKKELRAVEKALRNDNFAEAKQALKVVEPLKESLDKEQLAEYNLFKAQAYFAAGAATQADAKIAVEAFQKIDTEEIDSNNEDYIELKQKMVNTFLEKGQKAYEAKDFKNSSLQFENIYNLSPQDTVYLYYAAATAISEPDYDRAIKLYEKLRELKYTGITTEYTAVNKETNEVEPFASKNYRDIQVKAGTHIKPEMRKTESRSAEIIKNMALIYADKGETGKAIKAAQEARIENPDDINLLITEANLYYKNGDKQKFQELLEEATKRDPNNAELQFNLGVLAAEAGDKETAKAYYKKTLEIDPEFAGAQLNMAVLVLEKEQGLIDEMNALGNSAADNKRYDELLLERKNLYREAIPYLENVLKNDPENVSALKTLSGIYSALGEDQKFKTIKAKLDVLGN